MTATTALFLEELTRGTEEIIGRDTLTEKLQQERPLRIKAGFDPTAPDLHLGHTVLMNKLRFFQENGHEIFFLIGDFTAMIGDPSGRNVTRPSLTEKEILENAATYQHQVGKILALDRIQVVRNSEWLQTMSAKEIIQLAAQETVARMLEREDFAKRYQERTPIGIHEFLYPLLQGYDSVALKADIEIGGTDQKFNLLMGRALQKKAGQSPQVVITVPLLEGLDGVRKMSKSFENSIGIMESAEEMFGKIMSLSDRLMWRYFELLSFRSSQEILSLQESVALGRNPRDVKLLLAKELVARFHNSERAEEAETQFIRQFRDKCLPESLAEIVVTAVHAIPLSNLLQQAGLTTSTSEALRLMKQGAVRVDGELVRENNPILPTDKPLTVQIGKRRFAKITLKRAPQGI